MKKIITIITATILAIALIAIACTACGAMHKANAYTRTTEGTVIAVNNDVVTVKTTDGNVWEFEGEGFEVGQTVEVVFSNNGSPDCVKDDIIQWVR